MLVGASCVGTADDPCQLADLADDSGCWTGGRRRRADIWFAVITRQRLLPDHGNLAAQFIIPWLTRNIAPEYLGGTSGSIKCPFQ